MDHGCDECRVKWNRWRLEHYHANKYKEIERQRRQRIKPDLDLLAKAQSRTAENIRTEWRDPRFAELDELLRSQQRSRVTP
jgi:hypothetical protein